MSATTRQERSPLRRLAPRELEVLELMARGLSNPAIAQALHLSLSAVEKHVSTIFAALDLPPSPETHRRVAAVLAYFREGGG